MARARCKTKISWNGQSTSLLSWTEDMDAWSFSLPAGKDGACPMMVARNEEDVCWGCYAMQNRYSMDNVLRAQIIRLEWTKGLVMGPRADEWIDVMIEAIDLHVKNGYFRVHDSGDLFHPAYIMAWYDVCRQLPHIRFWFPTRSWQARNPKWTGPMELLASLPNVTVRPSAIKWNEHPPCIPSLSAGTMVVEADFTDKPRDVNMCPKTVVGGTCSENGCRICWYKTMGVAYLIHGRMSKAKMSSAMTDKNQAARKRISLTVKGQVCEVVPQ